MPMASPIPRSRRASPRNSLIRLDSRRTTDDGGRKRGNSSARWVFPDAEGTRRTAPTLVRFVATGFIDLAATAAIIDGLTRNHAAGAFSAKAAAVVTACVIVFLLRRPYVFAA